MAVVAERGDFTFATADLDTEVLRVLRFRGLEGISQLTRFDIELVSPDAATSSRAGRKARTLAWKGMEENAGSTASSRVSRWSRGPPAHLLRRAARAAGLDAHVEAPVALFQNLATPAILKRCSDAGVRPTSSTYSLSAATSRGVLRPVPGRAISTSSRGQEEEGISTSSSTPRTATS